MRRQIGKPISAAPGLEKLTHQPLYDSYKIPASATSAITFFQVCYGSTGSGYSSSKDYVETNMTLAGQLSSGYGFRCFGLALILPVSIVEADINAIVNEGLLTFWIGDDPRLRLHLARLGSGGGVVSNYSTTATTTTKERHSLGSPSPGNFFKLLHPIEIESRDTFRVDVEWAAAITPSAATVATLYLEGELFQPVR